MEYYRVKARQAGILNNLQFGILDFLLLWRDFLARVEDEGKHFVLPNDIMFSICKDVPLNLKELDDILLKHPKPGQNMIIKNHSSELLKKINELFEKHRKLMDPEILKKKAKKSSPNVNSHKTVNPQTQRTQ